MEKNFNSHDANFKRHLTLQQAEEVKKAWDHDGDDEKRTAKIIFKSKTNDYTVKLARYYNS